MIRRYLNYVQRGGDPGALILLGAIALAVACGCLAVLLDVLNR